MTDNQFLIAVSTELNNLNVEHLADYGKIAIDGITFSDRDGEWAGKEYVDIYKRVDRFGDTATIGTPVYIHLDLSPDPTPLELATAIKRAMDGKARLTGDPYSGICSCKYGSGRKWVTENNRVVCKTCDKPVTLRDENGDLYPDAQKPKVDELERVALTATAMLSALGAMLPEETPERRERFVTERAGGIAIQYRRMMFTLTLTHNCSRCSAEMDANDTGICNRCNPVTRDEPNGAAR